MSWRERARLQGWRLWAVAVVLAYTLLGFLVLPWVARNQAPKLAEPGEAPRADENMVFLKLELDTGQ